MSTPSHFDRKALLIQEIDELRFNLERRQKALALMEEYEKFMGLGTKEGKPFAELTKGDAAELLLEEAGGQLSLKYLFEQMKVRSHPVQTVEALRTLLEKDKRFIRTQPSQYDLAERSNFSPSTGEEVKE